MAIPDMSRHDYHQRRSSQKAEYVRGNDQQPDVTLTGITIGKETVSGKAIFITVKDQALPVCMPLSQVKSMVRAGTGIAGQDTMVITGWIAKQKGLA